MSEGKKHNIVQEKSYDLAIQIVGLVKKFPKGMECYVIGNQLLRAGTSIGANIEEAIAGFSKDDFVYKMSIALKEARETHYWLRIVRDIEIVKLETIAPVLLLAEEVMRLLGAIVRSSRNN